MKLVHLSVIIAAFCTTQPAAAFNKKHYACVAGLGTTALAASIVYDWQANPAADKNLAKHAYKKLIELAITNPITFAKNNKLIAASIYGTALAISAMKGRDYRALQINRAFKKGIELCDSKAITDAIQSGTNPNQPVVSSGGANDPHLPLEYAASSQSDDSTPALAPTSSADADSTQAANTLSPLPITTGALSIPTNSSAKSELPEQAATATRCTIVTPPLQTQTQAKPSAAAGTNLTLRMQPQTRRPKIKPMARPIIPIQPPRQLSPEADFFESDCKGQLLSILNLQADAIVSETDKELLRRRCFDWMHKSDKPNRIIGSLIRILTSRENDRAIIRKAIETYE